MDTIAAPELRRPRRAKSWTVQRIAIIVIAVLGAGVLLYPSAAAWFSDRDHATEMSGYVEQVDGLGQEERNGLLDEARAYNAALPAGPLRDPYTLNERGEQVAIGNGAETYEKMLDVGEEGMMGQVNIPSIGVQLPIFHGTSDATLARGVGHLFGSALPVGGTGTHSVLTAHSGFVHSTLFDHLNQVKQGDVFTVTVLDETLYYKVTQILTVLPEDTEALRRVEGKDLVTLVTCTPTGVNSHRLLVRGERIAAPSDATGDVAIPSTTTDPGFPWWTLIFVSVTAGAVFLTRPQRRRRDFAPAV